MRILSCSLMFLFLTAQGQAAVSLSQAQQAFEKFKLCSQQTTEAQAIKCLQTTTASDLADATRKRLYRYLHEGFSFSSLRECGEADKIQVVVKKPEHVYFCLDVLGRKTKSQGYIDFKSTKTGLGLSAIRYGL